MKKLLIKKISVIFNFKKQVIYLFILNKDKVKWMSNFLLKRKKYLYKIHLCIFINNSLIEWF